jgi:predicted AAA+ superfamily ATPase
MRRRNGAQGTPSAPDTAGDLQRRDVKSKRSIERCARNANPSPPGEQPGHLYAIADAATAATPGLAKLPRLGAATSRPMTSETDWGALLPRVERLIERIEALIPHPLTPPSWDASIAFRYRKRGASGWIEPVRHVAGIRLGELREVEPQKQRLLANTRHFVAGRRANNVLLTGARGTGKSSLIKAVLNEFAAHGLRLIEVDKGDLVDLPDIVDLVAERPERFIVYCDDLSFDEGEPGYKALKSILDGSVAQSSDNLLIYATSNRRHLLPEYMHDNLDTRYTDEGEIHPGEVVEEKTSLSERFGLWISFYPFSQQEYLTIVEQWLRAFGVDGAWLEAARPAALVWALERGSRSGRVAKQFARDWSARDGDD